MGGDYKMPGQKLIWNEENTQYITDNWQRVSMRQMTIHLHTTPKIIKAKALELGLPEYETNRWTKEEEEFLIELAPSVYIDKICKQLGKSKQSIRQKAKQLGIPMTSVIPVWDEDMEQYLKENIGKIGITALGKKIGVTYNQLLSKMEELGIPFEKREYWSNEEIEKLRELGALLPISELMKHFNRGKHAILHKAKNMGIEIAIEYRRFTDEEKKYVTENWDILSANEIARKLKCSRMQLDRLKKELALKDKGQNIKWDDEQLTLLRELAKTKSIAQLARKFKTSNVAIITVAHRNGITLIDSKVVWSEKDNKKLRKLAKIMDLNEIALAMGRPTSAVRLQAKRQNIPLMLSKNRLTWTSKDDDTLKQLADDGKTAIEISQLTNFSDVTIMRKAKELNLNIAHEKVGEWSSDEISRFKELAKTLKVKQLVLALNRSSSSIITKAASLGIKLLIENPRWSEEEFQLLEKLVMIDKKTPEEIANILGRTLDSITVQSRRRNLILQTSNKRFWTKEEEEMLSDMWGTFSVDLIAKKLKRTVSSVKNKVVMMKLGSTIANNYDGLTVQEICDLFGKDRTVVSITWAALGLKFKEKKISAQVSYKVVDIDDLFAFLENYQHFFDSRVLEKNILGKEPEWLLRKRELDAKSDNPVVSNSITKEQLIAYRKQLLTEENVTEKQYVKKKI